MDLTILWVMLGVAGGIGVIVGLYYGLKALGIDFAKIFKGIDISLFILNLAESTINEILKDNPALADKVDDIIEVIESSLDFIRDQLSLDPSVDKDELIAEAKAYADSMLTALDIQLSEGEKLIVYDVIKIIYNAWAALPTENK